MSEEDVELYRAWRAGDRKRGRILVERHYDAVVRFFRMKLDAKTADDLVQRTFLVCVDATSEFRGDGTFKAYLFGIARRVLLSHYNDKHRLREDPDFNASSAFELQPGPVTVAAARADQRLLVEALRKIPVEMQITLELFYWEGLGVDELAAALDIPVGTVKSRLHRARTILREIMQKLPAPSAAHGSVRALVDQWAADLKAEHDVQP